MVNTGKLLIAAGIVLIIAGIIFVLGPRAGFPGKLPGDIIAKKGNFTFYFPITTSILASVLLSIVLWFISRK
jgi:hypothetical protein